MTDPTPAPTSPAPLTASWQHKERAAELAATARGIYQAINDARGEHGDLHPTLLNAHFQEMQAVAALAQVHATLATVRDGA
ncbi:hypothetical protein AB0I89_24175 [Micromonospora sp. NPDC049801]|uniref:hypothetical protein n=1 Tax=unclassified Micromonospora TaxID=2617518 RepID=UPI00340F00DC